MTQYYDDDDLRKLYGKSYFEKRYEQNQQNWNVKANFIKNQFSPKKVLDIGCAEGFMVKELNKLGIDSYGIDGSEYALEKADLILKNKLHKVNLNKDKFPFNHESFDFVCSLHTIEHVHNMDHLTNELFRILKHNGIAWIVTPNSEYVSDNLHDVNMKKFRAWKEFFNRHGFRVKKQRQYGFLELKGKLRPLRLYKLPEPLLSWIKFLIYSFLNRFAKKDGSEASFLLIKP